MGGCPDVAKGSGDGGECGLVLPQLLHFDRGNVCLFKVEHKYLEPRRGCQPIIFNSLQKRHLLHSIHLKFKQERRDECNVQIQHWD
jgi:hypothetical protein